MRMLPQRDKEPREELGLEHRRYNGRMMAVWGFGDSAGTFSKYGTKHQPKPGFLSPNRREQKQVKSIFHVTSVQHGKLALGAPALPANCRHGRPDRSIRTARRPRSRAVLFPPLALPSTVRRSRSCRTSLHGASDRLRHGPKPSSARKARVRAGRPDERRTTGGKSHDFLAEQGAPNEKAAPDLSGAAIFTRFAGPDQLALSPCFKADIWSWPSRTDA